MGLARRRRSSTPPRQGSSRQMKKSGSGSVASGGGGGAPTGKGKKAPKKPPFAGPTIPPANVGPTGIVPAEGVRQAAKALGLAEMGHGVAAFVAQSVEYQLREVIEDAIKVCGYRGCLCGYEGEGVREGVGVIESPVLPMLVCA